MGHSIDARTNWRMCVFNRSDFLDLYFRSNPNRASTYVLGCNQGTFPSADAGHCRSTHRFAGRVMGDAQFFEPRYRTGMSPTIRALPLTARIWRCLACRGPTPIKTLAKRRDQQLASWSIRCCRVNDSGQARKGARRQRSQTDQTSVDVAVIL